MKNIKSTVQTDLFNGYVSEKISTIQYRGNKFQVLDFITPHFKGAKSILDLMAGSQSVGAYYKKYAKIISNDVQYYSYVLGKAYVENNKYKALEIIPIKNLKYNPKFNLFSEYYAEKYFTVNQAKEIDMIRSKIKEINEEDELMSYCYLVCLLKSLDLVSRTAGHFYGYVGKGSQKAKSRENKSVYKQFSKICKNFKINTSNFDHECYNLTAIQLLKRIENIDLIYMDPPYNRRQYSNYYHILEMCAKYEGKLKKDSITLLPEKRFLSKFCDKNKVRSAFKEILDLAKDIVNQKILISYTNGGLLSKEELNDIFRDYTNNLEFYEKEIQYTRQKTSNKSTLEKEMLFILNLN